MKLMDRFHESGVPHEEVEWQVRTGEGEETLQNAGKVNKSEKKAKPEGTEKGRRRTTPNAEKVKRNDKTRQIAGM